MRAVLGNLSSARYVVINLFIILFGSLVLQHFCHLEVTALTFIASLQERHSVRRHCKTQHSILVLCETEAVPPRREPLSSVFSRFARFIVLFL